MLILLKIISTYYRSMINRTEAISSLPSSSSRRRAATQTHGELFCSCHDTHEIAASYPLSQWTQGLCGLENCLSTRAALHTIHPWDTLSQPFATNFFSLSRNLSFNLGPKQFSFCPPIWYWLLAAAGIGNTFVLALQCSALWVASRL